MEPFGFILAMLLCVDDAPPVRRRDSDKRSNRYKEKVKTIDKVVCWACWALAVAFVMQPDWR